MNHSHRPLNDRVLIRRIDEPEQRIGSIIVPDIAQSKAIKGEIVAIGLGKWHPGEFWCVKGKWQWLEGWRERPNVLPGQIVYFNSKWDDSDGQLAANLHLVQEADIFVVTH